MITYLDYNASTPIDNDVLELMIDVYRHNFGNADSRTHNHGLNARNIVETARKQVSELLAVDTGEVFFTSGATESSNLVIKGIAKYGIENNKKHIITTAIEHKATLEPCKFLEQQGFEIDYILPTCKGRIDSQELISKLRSDTLLVSIQSANNETGVIQPVEQIGKACRDNKTFFHIDAAQTCGKLVDELRLTSYDFLSITSHKMYGPQGIGAAVIKKQNYKRPPLQPQILGGGQENGIRSGTLPVALIAGFGKAAELANFNYKEWREKYIKIKKTIIFAINESGVKYLINGDQEHCLENTLNVAFIGVNSEALMLSVKAGCSIANGSACTSKDYQTSYVLRAMGISEDIAKCSLRLSWGKDTSETNIDQILSKVKEIV